MALYTCLCLQTRGSSGPPRGGVSIPSLSEGPVTIQGSGPPRKVRSSQLFGLSACFSRNTWCSQTLPSRGTGPGPLLGEQDSGLQGFGCLDVVKDNHKALA